MEEGVDWDKVRERFLSFYTEANRVDHRCPLDMDITPYSDDEIIGLEFSEILLEEDHLIDYLTKVSRVIFAGSEPTTFLGNVYVVDGVVAVDVESMGYWASYAMVLTGPYRGQIRYIAEREGNRVRTMGHKGADTFLDYVMGNRPHREVPWDAVRERFSKKLEDYLNQDADYKNKNGNPQPWGDYWTSYVGEDNLLSNISPYSEEEIEELDPDIRSSRYLIGYLTKVSRVIMACGCPTKFPKSAKVYNPMVLHDWEPHRKNFRVVDVLNLGGNEVDAVVLDGPYKGQVWRTDVDGLFGRMMALTFADYVLPSEFREAP